MSVFTEKLNPAIIITLVYYIKITLQCIAPPKQNKSRQIALHIIRYWPKEKQLCQDCFICSEQFLRFKTKFHLVIMG